MPVIIVAPLKWTRSPLQIFLLILCVFSGLLIMTNHSESQVIHSMGEPWSTLWGAFLLLGSLIALLGIYWKNQITGMLIERSGIVLLGGASLIWPILVLSKIGWAGIIAAIFTLGFSAACVWQVAYINHHMNLILHAINKSKEPDE